jgi:hypothetical protein
MSGFDSTDYDLGTPAPARRREGSGFVLALVAGAILLASAGGWYFLRERAPAPPPASAAVAADAPPAAGAAAAAEVPLPALGASDGFLRQLVGGLTAHPGLASWLVGEDLARRFVAAVVGVAEGRSPAEPLRPLAPAGAFRARHAGGRLVADPASFHRYDLVTDVFASIDVAGAARAYRRVHPLLEEAYREIGDPASTLDATLARAVARLVAVPVPAAPGELVDQGGSYHWADHDLERLSAAEKHLLRLGPDNGRRVQAKLGELASALALPAVEGETTGGPGAALRPESGEG